MITHDNEFKIINTLYYWEVTYHSKIIFKIISYNILEWKWDNS